MYLGQQVRTVRAEDAGSIRAVSRAQKLQASTVKAAIAVPSAPTVTVATAAPVISVSDAQRVVELERQLAQAREMTKHTRGRLMNTLNVLRGKNRTIARLERELAAHSSTDQLTVAMLLNEDAPTKVS